MPRQVVFIDNCDFCVEESGEENAGEVLPGIAIAGVKHSERYEVIACDRHRKEIFDPLVRIIQEYGAKSGQPAKPPAKRSGPVPDGERQRLPQVPQAEIPSPCELCTEFFGRNFTAKNPQSLQGHRATTHQLKASAYRLYRHDLAELSIEDKDKLTLKIKVLPLPAGIPDYLKCPADGCNVKYDPHEKGEDSAYRSLANHTARSHPELPPLAVLVA